MTNQIHSNDVDLNGNSVFVLYSIMNSNCAYGTQIHDLIDASMGFLSFNAKTTTSLILSEKIT